MMMGSGDEEEEVGAELRAVLNDGEEVVCFLLAAGAQDSEGSDASEQQAFPTQGAARREFMALIKHRRRHHEYPVLVGTLGNEQDPMAKVTLAFPVLESTAVKVCLDEHRTDANNMALATGISIDGDVVDKGRVTSMRYEFSCDPSGASTDAIHSFILATHEAMDIASQHRFRSISVSHTWVVHRKSWAPSSRDDRGRAGDDDDDHDGDRIDFGDDDDDDGDDDDTGRMRWNSRTEQHMLSFVQHRNITDKALLQMWKEEWIRSELARRQDEYTDYEPLNICVGTFNVNGRKPDTSLAPWLLSGDHDSVDLFILGFQEVDLSKEAYVFESKREEEWVTVINSILSPLGYVKLRSKQLVGMLLLAFTRRELLPHVGQVSTCAMGTGVMNMLGNKGGVGFSIPFRDSHLCFLNTHLAAHDDNVARRNQNHHDLCKGISFRTGARTRTIFDHDYLFWLGDLNYRIDLFDATIKAAVQKMNLEELLEHDQLRTQQRIGAAFTHFVEPAIAFAPTYKYDIGTSTFDTSEKQRSPAYCDRILFYQPPDGTPLSSQVSVLEYTSAHAITISDHKPVRGRFRLNLRVINEERRRATRALVVRELDVIENSALPDVTLDSQELHFPHVHVGEKYTQQLTIANVGKVVAHFQFAAKDGETEPHPRWMHVDCGAGFVMPGHKVPLCH
ncbi:hypothetical protein PTSG_02873 [Salpingoeca rosetta]|uniref:Inositol polyphosphate-related phosphatase domain-containing protein n=1 Tax=Salpingoeca rosetta (strain ATCC 50818 / BSB-021) TaxID=946362 RepID=F2U3K6_SALR5|nr:uncharacterized protein PTSG_02873 [Salpingoeca rosetta]EGD82200.1 hypothetical protein PTSG_02873 [Salpingoeca rosetta]|eukprot:XP_004996383.1 hypothetical protein PTSG_02873 [Salpingoeca rosetta]